MALNKTHVATSQPAEKYRSLDLSFKYDTSKCARCGADILDNGKIRICNNCFTELKSNDNDY